jgi:hypothetical protein
MRLISGATTEGSAVRAFIDAIEESSLAGSAAESRVRRLHRDPERGADLRPGPAVLVSGAAHELAHTSRAPPRYGPSAAPQRANPRRDGYLEDTRRWTNWAATSPLAQDLILSVGGLVLGVGIVNSVKLVAARVRSTNLNQDRPERKPRARLERVHRLRGKAFRARKLRCTEITKKAKYWYLTADCDGREIEAKLSLDGVVVFARWKPYGPETSELPDPD